MNHAGIWVSVALIALVLLWRVWLARPIRVGKLEKPLSKALAKMVAKKQGSVVVDAGTNFVQFFLRPADKVLMADLPVQQFHKVPREAIERLGFTLIQSGSQRLNTYQREFSSVEAAAVLTADILHDVFAYGRRYFVTLITDYSKAEPPPDEEAA